MSEFTDLKAQAARCRRLAHTTPRTEVAITLTGMADEYERQAREIEARLRMPPPR